MLLFSQYLVTAQNAIFRDDVACVITAQILMRSGNGIDTNSGNGSRSWPIFIVSV